MDLYDQIFENNKAWVQSKLAVDKEFFTKLAIDQKPHFLYIGCSDSRVPANVIMGLDEGEVFVHRNIANMVVSADNNINAVIQYAVEFLEIQHIIVCGHYGCGGVKAALHPTDMGQLNSWLQTLRDVYRIHQQELDNISDPHQKFDRLVELNVIEQCVNIAKIDHVQRKWKQTGFPQIHAWVYDLHNGLLKELDVDLGAYFASLSSIYSLNIAGENEQ
jgi:carbonic anhydrase